MAGHHVTLRREALHYITVAYAKLERGILRSGSRLAWSGPGNRATASTGLAPGTGRVSSAVDERLEKEGMLIGSPSTVRETIVRPVAEGGINYLNCLFAFGGLSHERVMRSMRLFTKEVMPAFA
jgi:alkanesulfonate monooxygenase SsuD/methylene tetrahydromethanopterin reductase-like flavin-dependent oxidoreductase (luciferase family)